MNRLTGRKKDGHAYVIGCPEFKVPQKANILLQSIADKCADLEDILGDTYDLDRVRELVEEDKAGRCVVLPCKVGEKVYDIASGYVTEKTVILIPFMLSKSVNYLCLHAINKRDAATTIEHASIGKTVFLTREAAEAALAKEDYHE